MRDWCGDMANNANVDDAAQEEDESNGCEESDVTGDEAEAPDLTKKPTMVGQL